MHPVISFECKLISPFHSSLHMYSNVYTCSSYVLGTTLRGAILRFLIERYCSALEELNKDNPGFHSKCQEDCPIKRLFSAPTRFSFGVFKEEKTVLLSRVGISRESRSAYQGALLTLDAKYGTFRFNVMLPDSSLSCYVKEGIDLAGRWGGIGRYRGVGWGRFTSELNDYEPEQIDTGERLRFRFKTPYVLQQGNHPPITKDILERDINLALA